MQNRRSVNFFAQYKYIYIDSIPPEKKLSILSYIDPRVVFVNNWSIVIFREISLIIFEWRRLVQKGYT